MKSMTLKKIPKKLHDRLLQVQASERLAGNKINLDECAILLMGIGSDNYRNKFLKQTK